ncbi:MAG: RNA-guided pseudouridylation complex pseudouridine synthase subunit Cbf5 [Nanoarchaeota archaeon]|nr:RNA-guided pseudouridylation complex pseudouridine synthase subunit Cbf5 [Nanoarchaeota archaeon]
MINLKKIRQTKPIKELLQFSIINIDKPSNPTSFDIDQIIKKSLGLKKTSHFGTLDPKVTGVLPVALDRACKLMGSFIGKNKSYVGIMRIHEEISEKELKKELKNFIGEITQLPPIKSRVKRQERKRTIHTFKILEIKDRDILFETEVQAGTYIRKLIHDLGEKIGGAHMLELRRTKASIFEEKNSHTIYKFLEAIEKYKQGNESELRQLLIPGEIISKVLPIIQVRKQFIKKLYHGGPLFKEAIEIPKQKPEKFALFHKDKFIGIYKTTNEKEIFARSEFVFQPLQ